MTGHKLGAQQQPFAVDLDAYWLQLFQLQFFFTVLLQALHPQSIVARVDRHDAGKPKCNDGKKPG